MDPDAAEIRVLGALIEKQKTTPGGYPLTLNALRLACNQSTNRDPVVDYDEATVRTAAQALGKRGWARFAGGHGSRAPKYRHLLGEALGLAPDELAVLCVLMLRGAQTPGELKQRAGRMHRFEGLGGVQDSLGRLIERELVERLERRPGQKEERYRQLLGGSEDAPGGAAAQPSLAPTAATAEPGSARPHSDSPPAHSDSPAAHSDSPAARSDSPPAHADLPHAWEDRPPPPPLEDRVGDLERELARLRDEIGALRRELGA